MSLQIIQLPPARRDMTKHFFHLAKESRRVASRFFDAAQKTFATLAENPGHGGLWENDNPDLKGLRVWPVKGFNRHLVFYIADEARIRIVRVLHSSQDIDSIFGS